MAQRSITSFFTKTDGNDTKIASPNKRKREINEVSNVSGNHVKKLKPKDAEDGDQSNVSSLATNNVLGTEKLPSTKMPETKAPKTATSAFSFSSSSSKTKDLALDYNPGVTASAYNPVKNAPWKESEEVPYICLAKTLALIEETSARLKITEILSNYFRSVICLSPDSLLHSVYLCLNKLAPDYEGIELNVGNTIALKAVAQATGRSMDEVKKSYTELGDIGTVAESSKSTQRTMFRPAPLTVKTVFKKLKEIASLTGNASMGKKVDIVKSMLVASRDCEARFVTRSITGKLRIGLAEQTVLAALGQATTLTPPSQEFPPSVLNAGKGVSPDKFKSRVEKNSLRLKAIYCECPNYDLVIPSLLKYGIDHLAEYCHLTPGVPLKPMLAHPTKGVDEVFKRFQKGDFVCEYKYDGERAQIHLCSDGAVKIYSRNSEDNTSKYPDIVERMPSVTKEEVKSFVIDTEAVAWDTVKKQILPFQVLSTRKRKDAEKSEIKVQVCVYAFDMLYLNGQSLVELPLRERREKLQASFSNTPGVFVFANSMMANDTDLISEFLDCSVKDSCEGLMVKSLDVDATYEIAKRSHSWLKLKKDYLDGIGDTLDLVVIGGYSGTGKRAGKYGGFLLACFDTENEEFQTICKIGTGFTDADLEKHTKFFSEHVIPSAKSYFRFSHGIEPDFWFDPLQVWEVKAADLSISPVHMAAAGLQDAEKGISLRFPRFIRIRDDKKPEEATTATQVADMYRSQQQIVNQKTTEHEDGEDDY